MKNGLDALQIHRSPRSDVEAVMAFYREALAEAGERIAELAPWRLAHEAVSGGFTPYVATDPDLGLVGAVAVVGCSLSHDGEAFKGSWQGNSVVLGSMRGRGVGARLVEAAAREAPAVLAKSTSPAMYGLRKKRGFEDVPNREFLKATLSLTVPTSAADFAKRAGALVVGAVRRRRYSARRPSPIPVQLVDHFDGSFDDLNGRRAGEPVLRISKPAAYLNWRYVDCPDRTHGILRAGGAQARGAAVVRARAGEGWLLDLIAESQDTQVVDALVAAALAWFRASGVHTVTTFSTLPSTRERLFAAGFFRSGSTPRFTYRGQLPSPESTPWDFWHGDGDSDLYG